MEHLMNCHGEMNLLLATLANFPLLWHLPFVARFATAVKRKPTCKGETS